MSKKPRKRQPEFRPPMSSSMALCFIEAIGKALTRSRLNGSVDQELFWRYGEGKNAAFGEFTTSFFDEQLRFMMSRGLLSRHDEARYLWHILYRDARVNTPKKLGEGTIVDWEVPTPNDTWQSTIILPLDRSMIEKIVKRLGFQLTYEDTGKQLPLGFVDDYGVDDLWVTAVGPFVPWADSWADQKASLEDFGLTQENGVKLIEAVMLLVMHYYLIGRHLYDRGIIICAGDQEEGLEPPSVYFSRGKIVIRSHSQPFGKTPFFPLKHNGRSTLGDNNLCHGYTREGETVKE